MMLRQPDFVRTDHHPFKTCDNFNCPFCSKSIAKFKIRPKLNSDKFFGNSPAPFVGRFGYPNVNVGVLSPPELTDDAWLYDAPQYWSARQFQIPQIVEYRSSLINSHSKSHIKSSGRILELSQEVGMASKPVELEMLLARKPVWRMSTDSASAPTGPSAVIRNARITSNPKIHAKVEKVHSDTDLKAADALRYLYKSGFDENSLTRLLSVGTVGIGANRKLVPTRWSITATDDIIGKQLISTVKNFDTVNDYSFYFGGYLGNYFAVIFFPEVWSYELFETLAGHSNYTTDYEPYSGRKYYVDNTAGGFYSTRLATLEHLSKLKRQSSVLILRFITEEYTVPLGVFVCRESVRKALNSKPMKFDTKELMLKYVKIFIKNKFGKDVNYILKNSKLLNNLENQRKLSQFI